MRLKMAQNSLFAVLLRSRWWISLLVAVAVVAAARALLPPQYWVFGAMGAFPFLVIAAIALVKQWRRPSERQTQQVVERVRAMAWREFAQLLEQAFARDGYQVQRIEGAADLAVTRAGRTALVAARRWKAARHGEEGIAALHAQMRERDASGCTYIALGQLSANAQAFARAHGVQVMQAEGLAQLLRTLPGRTG
ncbi:restriction endonuclease [Ramlibacter sp.]|uniref:restriction endonuclease n=1 Tax=Ramlibacter sp. TaxID=1917967 RepID=UPI002BD281E0|nr:restriction endonuclease [Ramlibacter sp.]HWI82485.1 restriction endonuclease [Ramlibacter sp.]